MLPAIFKLDYYTTISPLEDAVDHIQQPVVRTVDFDTKEVTLEGTIRHRLVGTSESIIKDLVDTLAIALAVAEVSPTSHEITPEISKKILERTLGLRSMVSGRV